jgi:hypothetical protein
MTLVFSLFTLQTLLGAVDTFWNHEWVEGLAARRAARVELALHALREFIYAFLFLALAWREWHGAWALLIAGALLAEAVITAADFVVEDRTRRLTAFERVLHTVLTLLFGVCLMALAPVLLAWLGEPTALLATRHGGFSILLTVMAAGMFAWGMRDGLASLLHFRPAEWFASPSHAPRFLRAAACWWAARRASSADTWCARSCDAATRSGCGRATPIARCNVLGHTCTW